MKKLYIFICITNAYCMHQESSLPRSQSAEYRMPIIITAGQVSPTFSCKLGELFIPRLDMSNLKPTIQETDSDEGETITSVYGAMVVEQKDIIETPRSAAIKKILQGPKDEIIERLRALLKEYETRDNEINYYHVILEKIQQVIQAIRTSPRKGQYNHIAQIAMGFKTIVSERLKTQQNKLEKQKEESDRLKTAKHLKAFEELQVDIKNLIDKLTIHGNSRDMLRTSGSALAINILSQSAE